LLAAAMGYSVEIWITLIAVCLASAGLGYIIAWALDEYRHR
jgi:hypothetical protein